ncbi:MAG: hypothetical protein ABFS37_13010, partial [Acidobacteriota bacterium]
QPKCTLNSCFGNGGIERLTRRAREAGFSNALEALEEFDREWSTSDPNPEILETWANRGPMESH